MRLAVAAESTIVINKPLCILIAFTTSQEGRINTISQNVTLIAYRISLNQKLFDNRLKSLQLVAGTQS